MRLRLLADEIPTRQDALSAALVDIGADIELETEYDEDIAWGSDPFDILCHKEQLGLDD